jgi:hypothetical protein
MRGGASSAGDTRWPPTVEPHRIGHNHPPGPTGVVQTLGEVGNDIMNLAELQAKLVALDAKEAVSRASLAVIAIAVGLVIAAASVPVALLGMADIVARTFQIQPGWAMLLTAAVALLFAGMIVGVFTRQIPEALKTFRRSKEEFERNLAWLRTVIVHSGRVHSPSRR